MVAYLTKQANKHPAAFLALIGRVLPLQVQDREASGKIIVEIVRQSRSHEPKLVEPVVIDQPANGGSNGSS